MLYNCICCPVINSYYRTEHLRQLNISGQWHVTWDQVTPAATMTLNQIGAQVTGSYGHTINIGGINTFISYGNIQGTLVGNILKGTWTEITNSGSLEFVFSFDGNSFQGKWGYGTNLNAGYWNGRRLGYSPTPIPSTPSTNISEWNTSFNKMILKRTGNQVTGNYEYANGKIEDGVLSGNILQGRWIENQNQGRFKFIFNDSRTSFTGTWGRGNQESGSGEWTGTLIKGQL